MPDVAGGVTEDKVMSKSFELVFAFDEVITTGGHKENITLQQVSHLRARYFDAFVVWMFVTAPGGAGGWR